MCRVWLCLVLFGFVWFVFVFGLAMWGGVTLTSRRLEVWEHNQQHILLYRAAVLISLARMHNNPTPRRMHNHIMPLPILPRFSPPGVI